MPLSAPWPKARRQAKPPLPPRRPQSAPEFTPDNHLEIGPIAFVLIVHHHPQPFGITRHGPRAHIQTVGFAHAIHRHRRIAQGRIALTLPNAHPRFPHMDHAARIVGHHALGLTADPQPALIGQGQLAVFSH